MVTTPTTTGRGRSGLAMAISFTFEDWLVDNGHGRKLQEIKDLYVEYQRSRPKPSSYDYMTAEELQALKRRYEERAAKVKAAIAAKR